MAAGADEQATVARSTITVLGAGSWGTALAMQLARNGHQVRLWGRNGERVREMQRTRQNSQYLPGISFPATLQAESELELALSAVDRILLAGPSHAFADQIRQVQKWLTPATGLFWASKGFEPGSGRLLHDVALDILGADIPLATITGPSFAREVAEDRPTAVTVAASTAAFGEAIAALFHGGSFRAYYSDDLVGAGLGGAVKNVLAVATGVCDGMALGLNARAALITRGLAEMMRLGRAMGADPRTLMGLAGMGDLVLTCTGELSRNRRLGLALGQGLTVTQAIEEIGQVVEGVKTAEEVMRLARRYDVELPICEQVHGMLYRDWNAHKGVSVLLNRELKHEYQ